MNKKLEKLLNKHSEIKKTTEQLNNILNNFGPIEQEVILSFINNDFENNGVRETCRVLSKKTEVAPNSIKSIYAKMKKYGFFKLHFPEKFQTIYKSFGTRLSLANIDKLKKKSSETNKSIQDIVNLAISEYCE